MIIEMGLPGFKKRITTQKPYNVERQRAGLGSDRENVADPLGKETLENKETLRFDNMDEIEHSFKKGDLPWPEILEVHGFKYNFYKSITKGLVNILKGKTPGYIIYHIPKEHVAKAKEFGLEHWMVFLFRGNDSSNLIPQGIAFTTAARGRAMYEGQEQIIGDVVLLKIALPSGVIALKGKVDTGADISSLHVDSSPKIVGDIVKFENHNASGNVISAPLVAKQAVKSSEGVDYRPVIELDIEINGKNISKAQFNLNDRSNMEHEVLIGQNVLEKGGFLVNPNQNNIKENETEEDLMDLTEDQIDDLMLELSNFLEENHNKED